MTQRGKGGNKQLEEEGPGRKKANVYKEKRKGAKRRRKGQAAEGTIDGGAR